MLRVVDAGGVFDLFCSVLDCFIYLCFLVVYVWCLFGWDGLFGRF